MLLITAAAAAAGLIARLASSTWELEERLEFSSGQTSLSQLQEQIEWPTAHPLHTPNVVLVWLIKALGGVGGEGIFFILVDAAVAVLLFVVLSRYYTSAEHTARLARENDLLKAWSSHGRPRLLSDEDGGGGVTKVEDEEDDKKQEEWSATALQQATSTEYAWRIGMAYWLCPATWLTCGAHSFAALPLLLCLACWWLAHRLSSVMSGAVFAVLCLLQGPSFTVLVACPVVMLNRHHLLQFAVGFALSALALSHVLLLTVDGWFTMDWEIRDLRPNVGLWWYLQTEVFDQYRGYFLLVLHSFPLLMGTVIAVFLHSRPELHLCYSLAVWCTFQPFPEVLHVFMAVLLMFCHPEFLFTATTKHTLRPCLLILAAVTSLMQPLMLHLWLDNVGGNANFYYFQGLISNGMVCILLVQFYLAVVARDRVMSRIGRLVLSSKKIE